MEFAISGVELGEHWSEEGLDKGWSDACKAEGLPLGVSIHASHAWTWLEPSQKYDGKLTKADGKGKWWEGMDPQELYAQNHAHSAGWENSGTIHSQWDWGNGASQPSAEYKQKFQNRVLELIDDYNPDMLYFDDTAMPFYGCDDQVGKNILQHYYNHSAALHKGKPEVVVTGKQLTKEQKGIHDVGCGTRNSGPSAGYLLADLHLYRRLAL